ncbi:alcohol dehydrogenase catalytic domain-containing protein [Rhizobium sp. C4]|uniref:alcohol dehydrogenase catalytic domain-containing protein n=1 Tax=Rhizobium sp. C4 TaxID=1349800 RepID=UPI001E324CD7|nr:alcohol dehydrogenase catalytic domain-containing protein [Rhizobium sp. C4]MCD2176054.1 alcohol dehydrogenase catalytic domain-containing protein [Rhizobium sp. C4]
MKAWELVENNAPLECVEIEDRQLKGSEIELEVTHCGVCQSDLHAWRGWYDLGGGKKLMLADRGITLPRALGHEIFGRVSNFGPDA